MAVSPTSSSKFQEIPSELSIPKQEEGILKFWEDQRIFEKSTEQTKDKPFYSFYDGPPFATGLPHYGHLIAGILKDVVPRYWTMRGFNVPRRFGWDCHGLPVEYEINKSLKIDSRKQILEMGIGKYNAACRSIVDRYSTEWKKTVKRIGRWVDMDNAYFTMQPEFMQSVWWVFKEMWDKGLIYEGYKVVPYSVGVSTPLSNFEANLNYKDVQDPAITVSFELDNEPGTYVLAWTTTPWTLPSNLGLAVGADIDYVTVESTEHAGAKYILAEALVKNFFADAAKYKITAQHKGRDLVGQKYKPLFPYFASKKSDGAFQIILAEHVTTESGTGIVHMAPAFGEEDYAACEKAGLPIVNPVDDDGMFTSEVPDYVGRRVKEADKDIIAALKAKKLLFKQETITHSYPYCWRSDTPLIYRAVETWFIRVEKIKERLMVNNAQTRWVPDHLRDGRFGKWLENARDWAISRNRFWGTPLPVWKNKEGEVLCVGSKDALEKLSGRKLPDLHLEFITDIELPSPTGRSPLKHVGSVLDCWMESGSMPYAQWGYPYTNKEQLEKGFPADFIAEGIDQTRGWFYTLMVISTALFDKPAFKNVIVNGLILAEDGKKMSKSLRNYPDPTEVLDQHGADAIRLYLMSSPAVKAQELRFSETGVREMVRKIMLRWWNAYSFFVNYANIDGFAPKGDAEKSPNILDQWILSRLNSLIADTEREMEAYRLYNVVPGLLSFVEELTNTYIRFNRRHFWQDGMPEEKRLAYETLFEVLVTFSKVMAPFTPFMAETMYQNLKRGLGQDACESVHLDAFPTWRDKMRKPDLESAVSRMEQLVLMGRNIREKISVRAKIPLNEMKIIHREKKVLDDLQKLESYFVDELNVRKVTYHSNEDDFVRVSAKANFPVLGKRLGKKMKQVAGAIEKLPISEILKLETGATLSVEGESISLADLEIRRAAQKTSDTFSTHQLISIELDPTVTEEQIEEGLVRECLRAIQNARKTARLQLDDRIKLRLSATPLEGGKEQKLIQLLKRDQNRIATETLATSIEFLEAAAHTDKVLSEDILDEQFHVGLSKA